MKTLTPMTVWLNAATADEQEALADRIGTSRAMLKHYAKGRREMSAERAGKIEAVTAGMHKASKRRLPKVMRTDVCEACRQCPYAIKCLGERAVVSEFPIVSESQGEKA